MACRMSILAQAMALVMLAACFTSPVPTTTLEPGASTAPSPPGFRLDGVAEPIRYCELAVASQLESVLRYRWAGKVAPEALEALAVVGRNADLA